MVRTSRRHSSSLQTTLKDYLVPIIGWLLILLLLYTFLKGDDTVNINTSENKNPTSLSFWVSDTEAYIVYHDDVKEKINETSLFYKWQSVVVKEGSLKLLNPDKSSIHLNKVWELTYNIDGSYELYSSDAWLSTISSTKISMRYASVEIAAESVVSLTQNEAGSTIYILSGSAKISNLAGISTSLVKWQKISISRINAANKDIDLSAEKGVIDSYFKGSDWFIDNQGHLILEKEEADVTNTDTLSNSGTLSSTGEYINFENLRDEMSVDTNTMSIRGTFRSEEVGSISINNTPVSLNASTNTFRIDGLSLWKTMNDIVVKVYDTEKQILEKSVFTVYTSTPAKEAKVATSQASNPVNTQTNSQVGNNNINPRDFWFTEPAASGTFTTTSWEITIRWYTNAKDMSAVQVNGFPLASFNGSTWRYHAFERFETLEEWTNQYKIDYFDAAGKVVYSDYYTIIKKQNTGTSTTPVPTISTPTSSSGGSAGNTDSSESELFAE